MKQIQIYHYILISACGLLISCSENNKTEINHQDRIEKYVCSPEKTALKRYLFIGHSYRWHTPGNKIDQRLEQMDLSCFDQVWLGGDMCSETTKEHTTLEYLDSIFDLGKPTTYWAVGNHDVRNGNLEWISEFTNRKTFYAHYNNGFTTVVLNTNFDRIREFGQEEYYNKSKEQYTFLKSVLDTIVSSSHLILLMHNVLWSKEIDEKYWVYANEFKRDWRFFNDSNATFAKVAYPELVKIQKKGIKIICIAGDAGIRDWGANKKYGQYKSPEGVQFLASGINNSKYKPEQLDTIPKDKILLLYHNLQAKEITWKIHDLDSLLDSQKILSPADTN